MKEIKSLNEKFFEFDGLSVPRNYKSIIRNEKITIINIYDKKDLLMVRVPLSEINLNGTVYVDINVLQIALNEVLFNKAGGSASPTDHTHSNKIQLDKIGENADGDLTYAGQEIVSGVSEQSALQTTFSAVPPRIERNNTQDAIEKVESNLDEIVSSTLIAFSTPLTNASSADPKLPDFNTTTNTFTLFRDTIMHYRNQRFVLPTDTSIVMSNASSTHKIYFNVVTKELFTIPWNALLTASQVVNMQLVAVTRKLGNTATLNITSTYTINRDLSANFDNVVLNGIHAGVKGIAHRGASITAPENTTSAYQLASDLGFSWWETDIAFTSDGIPVLMHDDTIDRTSNGTGLVSSMTLTELQAFDYGSWKSPTYAGEQILTFEGLLKLAVKLNSHIFVEPKGVPNVTERQTMLDLIKSTGMKGRINMLSFDLGTLQNFRDEDPTLELGFLGGNPNLISRALTLKTPTNIVSVIVAPNVLTQTLSDEVHNAGMSIYQYTLNTEAEVVTHADLGGDGVITDIVNVAKALGAKSQGGSRSSKGSSSGSAPISSDADILTGSSTVPSLFTAKQIKNETMALTKEITPVFWEASYLGYGDQSTTLGGRKYVIGSDGRIYIAQVDSVPAGKDPVLDDGTSWKYKGTSRSAPIEVIDDSWFTTSTTGLLIDVTPEQWANNPEITLKAKDLDTGQIVDVTVPANSTFSPSGFYGGDASFTTAPSSVTLAVIKRPGNKFQLTHIDQDGASTGSTADISEIKLDGVPVHLVPSTIDEYVSKKIIKETVKIEKLTFAGRYYLNVDGRWVGENVSYGLFGENKNQSFGTGVTPSLRWNALGIGFFPKGTIFHSIEFIGRVDTTSIEDLKVTLRGQGQDFASGYGGGTDVTLANIEEILPITILNDFTNSNNMKRVFVDLNNYYLSKDRILVFNCKATNLLTTTRYWTINTILKYTLPA